MKPNDKKVDFGAQSLFNDSNHAVIPVYPFRALSVQSIYVHTNATSDLPLVILKTIQLAIHL